MPLFEYECHACDGHFEKLTRNINSDEGEVACPGCGSEDVHKVISLFGVTSAEPGGMDFGNLPMGGMGGGGEHAGHSHNGIT